MLPAETMVDREHKSLEVREHLPEEIRDHSFKEHLAPIPLMVVAVVVDGMVAVVVHSCVAAAAVRPTLPT